MENINEVFHEEDFVPKKKKKYKKVIIISLIIIVIISIIGIVGYNHHQQVLYERKMQEEQELVQEIASHYNKFVRVNKDTILYSLNDNNYQETGTIYKDVLVNLDEVEITKDTKYFYSSELEKYLKYQDVSPIDSIIKNDRYKKYVPFNKNIITKESFTLYNKEGDKYYTFNSSMTFPMLIDNYENKYFVSYNNELMYLLKDDIESFEDSNNTNVKNMKNITTFCYHRVYNQEEKCTDPYICKKQSKFDQEMKYLKDNNYLTLTMEEMYLYLTGKLRIEKGVLLTFDDGYLMTSAIQVLEKYDLNASLFVITGRFKDFSSFTSPNLELHSHTNNMHNSGECAGYGKQGGGILCLNKTKVLDDLKITRERLNNPIAFAYPFYDYSDRAISLLKESGFKMAFIGAHGVKGKAKPGVNLYKIPRMTIWDTTSFTTWKNYL